MRTVVSLLEKASRKFADHPYLSGKQPGGWESLSFAETAGITDGVAAWFLSHRFTRGDRVLLLAEGRPEWVLAELGMLKAGLVSVPVSIKLLPGEIPFRVNHSGAAAAVISRITLPKILAGWEEIEKPPRLILLDDPTEEEADDFSRRGLTIGEQVVTWRGLLEEGLNHAKEQPQAVAESVAAIAEDDVVNICYTSGTTGNPKGIMLTHLNYWANVDAAVKHFSMAEAHHETLVILPLDHSFAHTVATYAGLAKAITLSFVDARDGAPSIIPNIPVNLKERNPTLLLTVPALTGNFMKKIIDGVAAKGSFINGIFTRGLRAGIALEGNGFQKPGLGARLRFGFARGLARRLVFPKVKSIFGSRMEFCVGGGAILEKKQQEFYAALGMPVYQGYGLTEAAPVISSNTPEIHKYGTSGRVLPGITYRFMKSENEKAAPGEKAQLVIRGENVMKGYFRNPEATAEALRDGWLWTGDLGYIDEDGFLMIVGREKALLISPDGEKYPPEEIEEAVMAATYVVSQIMAYNDHRKFTGALITLDVERCRELFAARNAGTADAALAVLEEELVKYKDPDYAVKPVPPAWSPTVFEIIPREFSEADQLINSTMKLVRHKVCEKYADRIEAMYNDADTANDRNRRAIREMFDLV